MKIKKDKKTGKYYFNAYLGMERGKPKRTTRRGFKTEREATIAYTKLITGQEEPRTRSLFCEVYEDWLEQYKNTVETSTLDKTQTLFRLHILPVFGHRNISKISLPELQKQVNDWAEESDQFDKLKNYTSKIFEHGERLELVTKNPCSLVIMPKKNKRKTANDDEIEENYFDREQLAEFLKKARERLPWQWYVFFYVLAFTGMRRGEALALQWGDINFAKKSLRISKSIKSCNTGAYVGSPKNEASYRTITLDDKTLTLLKEHKLRSEAEFVFANTKGSFHALSQPRKQLRKVTDEITPHGFRHTHCCLLFEAGASIAQVQQRMGHKNSSTTLNVYNHVTSKKIQEAAELFASYIPNFDYQSDYQSAVKSIPFTEKRQKTK